MAPHHSHHFIVMIALCLRLRVYMACIALSPGGVFGGTGPAGYVVRQRTDVIDSETVRRLIDKIRNVRVGGLP